MSLNIKLIISYDGSKAFGSQIQPNKTTIQGELHKALSVLNIPENSIFSGRTDKGVHALRQVVNIQIPTFWSDLDRLKNKLSQTLPPFIQIKHISIAKSDFHARFDAKQRVYRYIISTKKLNAFNNSYFVYHPNLDIDLLNHAIRLFEGEHNFEYFKKQGSDESHSLCKIYKAFVYRYKDYVIFYFKANRFLRSQIRIMVNFLLQINDKKLTISNLQSQLNKKSLIFHKPILPNGLYLSKVIYLF